MLKAVHRESKLIIDADAIRHNINEMIKNLNNQTDLFAVVKADAYGHGIVETAKIVSGTGVTGFCVAMLDEALTLREAGFSDSILVLGVTDVQFVDLAAEKDIALTVTDPDWLTEASSILKDNELKIHISVDTGMGRIGFINDQDVLNGIKYINDNKKMILEGVYTHFSTADEEDDTLFLKQLKDFKSIIHKINPMPKYIHVANTASFLWHRNYLDDFNMVRMGVGIYGLNPSNENRDSGIYLKPAMRLESNLSYVKEVKKGTTISYGAVYQAERTEWIGTVPIGYADGYRRSLQGFKVLIEGKQCEIVGRITMDQLMVVLPEGYKVGTKVVLMGVSESEVISASDLARYLGTINYEIICGFSNRLPRVYENLDD